MNSAADNFASLDTLLAPLLHLSLTARLEAIARLAHSLQPSASRPVTLPAPASILEFEGAWADIPGTDEEIVASVRQARLFNRPDIALD